MNRPIKFVSDNRSFSPDYKALWYHGGRFYIKADRGTVLILAQYDPLKVVLSENITDTLIPDSAEVDLSEDAIISWEYERWTYKKH